MTYPIVITNLGFVTVQAMLAYTYGHVTEKMKKGSANQMENFIKSVS